jgi:hypothetical protein
LQELLKKKVEMLDYECLVDEKGNRTVAFGRFAGIVGAYNAFRMWLERKGLVRLPAASECRNMEEMLDQVKSWTPKLAGVKMIITGTGRVGSGAREVFDKLGILRIDPESYTSYSGNQPVYVVLSSRHYLLNNENLLWNETDFRSHPEKYRSDFGKFAACSDVLISCHYWNPRAPALFALSDIARDNFRISVISDVTCDMNGSVPVTLRASTIADPFYDVSRKTLTEAAAFSHPDNISVCAVDNLPCELPLDASRAFGEMLSASVIPELSQDEKPSLTKATICRDGILMPNFAYLEAFSKGEE